MVISRPRFTSWALAGLQIVDPGGNMETAKILPFPGAEKQPGTTKAEPLTWERLRAAQAPPKGAPHLHLFDSTQAGFGAYITATDVRSYFVETSELQPDTKKWKRVRVTMRRVADCNKPREGNKDVQAARAEAHELIKRAKDGGQISKAAIAAAEALVAKPKGVLTFRRAYERYIAEATGRRGNPLRPASLGLYAYAFESLAPWHNVEMFSITRQMVSEMVVRLRKESQERLGNLKVPVQSKHTRADTAMRLFRAVWRFCAAEDDKAPMCPTIVMKAQKKWSKLARRSRIVTRDTTPEWWQKLHEMTERSDHYGREWWTADVVLYFRVAYLLGGRSSELRYAEWRHYDAKRGVWLFPGSIGPRAVGKYQGNKSERDHEVCVGPYLKKLLEEHRARKAPECKYIFADAACRVLDKAANFVDQFRQVFPEFPRWSAHDLRRTFLTVANSPELALPAKVQKLLVNHETENDVTEGYVTVEDKQYWSARMEQELLKRAGVDNKAAGKRRSAA